MESSRVLPERQSQPDLTTRVRLDKAQGLAYLGWVAGEEPSNPLDEIWRWLPVFRAVAESGSVSRAAERLGLSPPSVSRGVHQVEKALGCALFDRMSSKMVLNPSGEALFQALRRTTAALHEVVEGINAQEISGIIRIVTAGQLDRTFILPAFRTLREEAPRLRLSVVHMEPDAAIAGLEAGMFDLYLALNLAVGGQLEVKHLAKISLSVYAGHGHPLFERAQDATLEEMLAHPFVTQRRTELIRPVWPRSVPRMITLTTDSHALALDAALDGTHLILAEDVTIERLVEPGRLQRLAALQVPPADLVVVRHERSRGDSRVRSMEEALVRWIPKEPRRTSNAPT